MVSFTSTPTPAVDTHELDTQLRLTLGRSTAATPVSRARTGLTRGLGLGYDPKTVRSAVLRVAPDTGVALLPQASAHALLAQCEAHVSRSPLAPGGEHADVRLRIARRVVARVIAAVDRERLGWTKGDESNARIAYAVIGRRLLECAEENGSDAVLVTSGWLAAELNCSLFKSGAVIKKLESAGWIRHVGTAALARRWRLTQLDKELGDVAWKYEETINALATGIEGDDIADLIRSVRNPGWAYNPDLGLRAWLRLLYDYLGVRGRDAALGERQWKELKQALVAHLPELGTRPLTEILEDADPTAQDVKAERGLELAAESAKIRARLAEVRAERDAAADLRAEAGGAAGEMWRAAGPTPYADYGREHAGNWAVAAHTVVAGQKLQPEVADALAQMLAAELIERGHEDAVATKMAAYVAGSGTSASSAA